MNRQKPASFQAQLDRMQAFVLLNLSFDSGWQITIKVVIEDTVHE
ncbi:hypothetical protein [Paenibacillus sp. SN-8-1]